MGIVSDDILKVWLMEDIGMADFTTDFTISDGEKCRFRLISKSVDDFVLCGVDGIAERIIEIVTKMSDKSDFAIFKTVSDGSNVKNGDVIWEGECSAAVFLKSERLILNICQHLSGIATKTRQFIRALDDPKITILDTRKTLPNLRNLQKYAVKIGGGSNHRFSLSDLIMIKDNHISASGGVSNAINNAINGRQSANKLDLKIEVECDTIDQVREALLHKIDIIMLDNMDIDQIKCASDIIRSTNEGMKIEVSGNMNLQNISKYRGLDIDYISIGALTHSVSAIDISAEMVRI